MRLYQIKTPTCRSLRDLLFVILCVAVISAMVTYQLTKRLPTRSQAELTILLQQRNLQMDSRRGLEGIDFEERVKGGHPVSHIHRWKEKNSRVLEQIYERLKKIEDIQLGRTACSVVILHNNSLVLTGQGRNDTEHMFITNGCKVQYKVWEFKGNTLSEDSHTVVWLSESITSGKDIYKWFNYKGALPMYSKVNMIVPIEEMIGNKSTMCTTLKKLSHIPDIQSKHLFLDCFILPEQLKDYQCNTNVSDKWIYKAMKPPNERKLQLIDHNIQTDILKLKKWSQERAILQEYFPNPLLLYHMPFEAKFYVLVTSWSPLRAYVHNEGLVQLRHHYQNHFRKLTGRTWTFRQLGDYIWGTYNSKAGEVIFNNAHSVIVQTLLVLESHSLSQQTARCPSCFQLLEFDVIFNTSFHPVITQITTRPDIYDLAIQQKTVVKDLISIVTTSTQVAKDVAKMLVSLNLCFGSQDYHCLVKGGVLLQQDIQYLLSARREYLNSGGFQMLYPSPSSSKYTQFLHQLQQSIPGSLSVSGSGNSYNGHHKHHHSTSSLHSVLLAITKYFRHTEILGDSYDDISPQMFQSSYTDQLIEQVHGINLHESDIYTRKQCSTAPDKRTLLQSFHTLPNVTFHPQFNPNITDYYATVPYDTVLIEVWAFAEACQCEARIGNKYGLNTPSHYTLGLGVTNIQIHVIDTTHTDPWILKTYTLYLERTLSHHLNQDHSQSELKACRLFQDCGLKFIPGLPCGMQNTTFTDWNNYQSYRQNLPLCTNGYQPGYWLVPCVECSASHTCDMDQAEWQPHQCTHHVLPRHKLKQCLSGKQLLFIGDSTNRGMMYYLMEQVNGSLTEWDKTHHVKIYSNINDDRSTFGFAYYPQFWLTASQRPVFDKALYQLIKQSVPLENNHNTVIVVGGVHWLSTHHLSVLLNSLKREDLLHVKVIMKSLGAGFHQPVDGHHCLSQREQKKLLLHNNNLISVAESHGFQIVDTFNMTMARYKDFTDGQCACHFHRVKKTIPKSYDEDSLKQKSYSGPTNYYIEGHINRIYSEILINSICY